MLFRTGYQERAQAELKRINDPIEPFNRAVFDVNDFLDRLLIRPLAELYRFWTPSYLRDRVAILKNMGEPVVMANNLLQGEMTKAGTTLGRFLINTTAGVGGMYEVAGGYGLERQNGDFGQTLHVWGMGEEARIWFFLSLVPRTFAMRWSGRGHSSVALEIYRKYGDITIEHLHRCGNECLGPYPPANRASKAWMLCVKVRLISMPRCVASIVNIPRQKTWRQCNQMPVFDEYEAESTAPVLR